jgi:histidinol-phosphatase (PHP family)
VFASVHLVKGVNAYAPIYYEGRTKEEAYARYVEHIHACIRTNPYFCVLGHYDFCAKFAPYADRTFYYAHAPEHLDGIFRYLIEQGKGLEINTATWQDSPCWGLDALTRYRELGGEFVTFGSDAHRPGRVGWRINEAVELARAAGIPYTATFQAMQPTFHALDKL